MADVLAQGLRVRGLECTRAGKRIFGGLDLDASPGEVLQVRGANGSGKSSLLRMLCGLLPPSQGEMHWCGRRVRCGDAELAGDLAYMGHSGGMNGELTVLENLRFSLDMAKEQTSQSRCLEVLAQLRLDAHAHQPARRLSQGQRRRLSMARVLLSKRALWLLDEPCAGLDAQGEDSVHASLTEHARSGGVAIVTTHRDLELTSSCARTLDLDALEDADCHRPDHWS